MALVYLSHSNETHYAESFPFNPETAYTEYPFESISETKPNPAYRMVRECLIGLGYDKEHFGTNAWNPLGELLCPGETVVIKPNLVMDQNGNKQVKENAMECLVTHPSCVRAICDYCVIALKGQGRIVIADAPMQGCDFKALIKKTHLDDLVQFYLEKGIQVELLDLRQFQATFDDNKVIVHKEFTASQGILVHMGCKSAHYHSGCNQQYQVSDYEKDETIAHHHDEVHDYELAKTILEADLLINFCKPKTHRLAGITAAMKNLVGATYNKATLPHRCAGSKSEGGDAYLHKNWLKRRADWALTQKIRAEAKQKYKTATLLRFVYGAFLVAGRTLGKDDFYIGSWYGNDTIWRTVVDLNYIVKFADKEGSLHNTQQRKILCLGDMIVAGQRNGPVSPEPKELGAVLASEDAAAFDETVCRIMGFDPDKIPLLKNIRQNKTWITYQEPCVDSSEKDLCGQLSKLEFPDEWKFKAHDAWDSVLSIE